MYVNIDFRDQEACRGAEERNQWQNTLLKSKFFTSCPMSLASFPNTCAKVSMGLAVLATILNNCQVGFEREDNDTKLKRRMIEKMK